MKTLAVLVPIFNEDRTIQELVRQLGEIQDGVISECIFVNDGSTDSTLELLNDALSTVRFKHQVTAKLKSDERVVCSCGDSAREDDAVGFVSLRRSVCS